MKLHQAMISPVLFCTVILGASDGNIVKVFEKVSCLSRSHTCTRFRCVGLKKSMADYDRFVFFTTDNRIPC